MEDRLSETGAVAVSFGKRIDTLMEDGFEKAKASHIGHCGIDCGTTQTAELGSKPEETIDRHVRIAGSAFR